MLHNNCDATTTDNNNNTNTTMPNTNTVPLITHNNNIIKNEVASTNATDPTTVIHNKRAGAPFSPSSPQFGVCCAERAEGRVSSRTNDSFRSEHGGARDAATHNNNNNNNNKQLRAASLMDDITFDVSGDNDKENDDEGRSCPALRRFVRKMDPLFSSCVKWSLFILLVLFLSFVVFGILYSGIHYHDGSNGNELGSAATPFGTILGGHAGVFSYQNGDGSKIFDSYVPLYTSPDTNANGNSLELKSMYTGQQWECVEYARRYWMLVGLSVPAFFGSVDGAADIWELTTVTALQPVKTVKGDGTTTTTTTLTLSRFGNGKSVYDGGQAPKVGDIIIYPRQPNGFPYGHVAVVVEVSGDHVKVAEQNWNNRKWPGPFYNYSRAIPLSYDKESLSYTLKDHDGEISGWMRYGE